MGKPAARVGDMHTCPVPAPVPHVGGPLLPPGVITVLIGGMPAATVGNICVCAGPPDMVIRGSTGVFIGGRPAARMGDNTVHGGIIVSGFPTVLIGEIGGGGGAVGGDTSPAAESGGGGWLDGLQLALDIVGLIPGLGEIADGANALIYVARGDYANAALSVAAMIPIGGQAATAAKLGIKGADAAKTVAKNADEVADAAKIVAKKVPKKKPKYNELKTKEPCFLEGTLVKTPTGYVTIEKLNVGDEVLVYDFDENCVKEKRIIKLYNNFTYRYYEVKTDNGNSIFATSRHLFWVENEQKWIPTRDLHIGTQLKGINDELDTVLSIKETRNINLPTFNLEIEDIHNYFVGEFGILVHNQNGSTKFTNKTSKDVKIYEVFDTRTNEVKYVGQTDHDDVKKRFKEHLRSKDTKKISRKKWKKHYDVREVKSGHWTPYEAAVWEQRYIEKNGGKGKLENGRNEITEKKYNEYGKDKYGHNPCP